MNYLSHRFDFDRSENEITKILESVKRNKNFLDLTSSNPTNIFSYEKESIQKAMGEKIFPYAPDPKGVVSARESLVNFYKKKGRELKIENLFLASGTSEAMSFILKAITNADSEILLPTPGYPLYDFILKLENVVGKNYHFIPRQTEPNFLKWEINFEDLNQKINKNTKAIVLVEPQNPMGARLSEADADKLVLTAKEKNLILIVDEVFSDYYENYYQRNPFRDANCIFLNGLSKTIALPQAKLSWIYISGDKNFESQMKEALEIICDTYLSVNSMVQYGLDSLLETATFIQNQIRKQIQENIKLVQKKLNKQNEIEWYRPEGGWYMLLRLSEKWIDETFSIELLKEKAVYLFPGYMFDIKDERFIVISLIVPSNVLEEGLSRMLDYLGEI